ncbi:uncharacterized protein LOC141684605 [Apium graveolens]|uniref:uncharacterized protein LOC141684605 n=1 Tax=Apium graveolens TaxID=4045 RepID=UPI003D7B6F43
MGEHVPEDPLFVLKLTTSCETLLEKLIKGLRECHGTVCVDVDEEKMEVRVRGNVQPLELTIETQLIMGEKARLAYYDQNPASKDDFKSKSKGKEEEDCYDFKREEEDDHDKPYVYKEHKPVRYPSSMSGQDFFDYFGVGSDTCQRNGASRVEPSAQFPGYSPGRQFNPAFPMRRSAHQPHFY